MLQVSTLLLLKILMFLEELVGGLATIANALTETLTCTLQEPKSPSN